MSPDEVDKLVAFGEMAFEQGWYDKAREYFEQALVLDPSNREAMKGLARANEILSRRASFEPIKPEAPPAKPASKGHPIAEWVREKRRAYAEWMERRRKERAERTAERERVAAERQRYREMLEDERRWALEEWEAEQRWLAGPDGYWIGDGTDDLADAIVHGGLLDDGDMFDGF
jgi:tetratricopeptide (TPR) repeat protein